MRKKIKPVTLRVHPEFFDFFEKKRKSYQDKLKVNISQVKTSELISKEMIKKIKPKIKTSKKYYPKKFKQNRFII